MNVSVHLHEGEVLGLLPFSCWKFFAVSKLCFMHTYWLALKCCSLLEKIYILMIQHCRVIYVKSAREKKKTKLFFLCITVSIVD